MNKLLTSRSSFYWFGFALPLTILAAYAVISGIGNCSNEEIVAVCDNSAIESLFNSPVFYIFTLTIIYTFYVLPLILIVKAGTWLYRRSRQKS